MRLGIVLGALGILAMALSLATPVNAKSSPDNGSRIENSPTQGIPKKTAALFGIDDGGVLYGSETTLNLGANLGVKWVRQSVAWDNIEPVKGTYDWTWADKAIKPLIEKGFTPFIFVGENPSWAASHHCGPVDSEDLDAFASLMGALAARYPGVGIWALYNEPDFEGTPSGHNGGCFGTRTAGGLNNNGKRDVDEYMVMLAKAWKAVHTANPSAKVSTGALAFDNFNTATAPAGYPGGGVGGGTNYHFLSELFTSMAANQKNLPPGDKFTDFVAFNYYDLYGTYYWQNKFAGQGIQAKANAIRQLMSTKGIKGVKLFVGETGEDSLSSNIGPAGQVQCLQMTMVRGAAAKLKGIIWWTFRDFPDTDAPPRNKWKYGVVDQNNQPKVSYTAFKTLATELNNYKYKGTYSNTAGFAGIEAYRFLNAGKYKYVVWSSTIANQSKKSNCSWDRVKRPVTFTATKIRTVNPKGKQKVIVDNSKKDLDKTVGKIAIKVGGQAMVVQINP
jgi:hypothetical protein